MSEAVPVHRAQVTAEKLVFSRPDILARWLARLKGQKVEVIIQKPEEKRSERQNRYYWAYLQIISDYSGDDPNSLHARFKLEFLVQKFVMIFGKEVAVTKSTTKLTKAEFSEYIMRIEALTGVPAPNPEDLYT